MPVLKGMTVNGFIEVDKAVRFKNALQSNAVSPFGKSWYVDYGNGVADDTGLTPASATKHLQDIIDKAAREDVIFVRPYITAAQVEGGDPAYILPESTANWIVPKTLYGLSIIGTGLGVGKSAAYQTNLKGSTTVAAVSTLDVRAPFVHLENLTFRRGSNTLAGVRYVFTDPGTTNASFGGSLHNCNFWKLSSSATHGALEIGDVWHMTISKCTFISCYIGIHISFDNGTAQGLIVRDCDFNGLTSEVSCNIQAVAGLINTLITGCNFNHALPNAGAPNVYVSVGATSSGMISNCFLGNASTTIATNMTLNGIVQSGCMSEEGEMVTD